MKVQKVKTEIFSFIGSFITKFWFFTFWPFLAILWKIAFFIIKNVWEICSKFNCLIAIRGLDFHEMHFCSKSLIWRKMEKKWPIFGHFWWKSSKNGANLSEIYTNIGNFSSKMAKIGLKSAKFGLNWPKMGLFWPFLAIFSNFTF